MERLPPGLHRHREIFFFVGFRCWRAALSPVTACRCLAHAAHHTRWRAQPVPGVRTTSMAGKDEGHGRAGEGQRGLGGDGDGAGRGWR